MESTSTGEVSDESASASAPQVVTNTYEGDSSLRNYYNRISEDIYVVAIAIITVVGLVGNGATIAVMRRPSLRSSSVSVFLSALAVSDTLVLILGLLNTWLLKAFQLNLLRASAALCKFYRFFFSVTFTYSSWLVLAVSVQRLLVITLPFKAKTFSKVKHARVIAALLVPLCMSIYVYRFWAWDLDQRGECNMVPAFAYFESHIGIWIEGAFYSYIPILVLVVSTGFIIFSLSRAATRRAEMTKDGSAWERKERRVTVMVVVVCGTFILLTAPVSIYYILVFALGQYMHLSPRAALAQIIIAILGTCNYAINFFLYVMTSEGFRQEFLALVRCCRSGTAGDGQNVRNNSKESGLSASMGSIETNTVDI